MLYGLSRLSKRSPELVVFGVHTRSFSGNVKALFLANDTRHTKVFISHNSDLVKSLRIEGSAAHSKCSIKGIYYSLRAGTYIYSGYPSDINFWLSGGAKYINVWHGTPIKKIERDISTGYYSKRNRYRSVYRIVAPYLLVKPDVFLASSPYEEKCFSSAFGIKSDSFVRAFPPRLEALVNIDGRQSGATNILYVPTWRDDHSFHFENYVDAHCFNAFLKDNGIKFYVKLHPSDKGFEIGAGLSHIITLDKNEDVYVFLREADVLVSDYSSMVFEGLYLSKPVVLFCPDYESYSKRSREFYIDPYKGLPVHVSYTQDELEHSISLAVKEQQVDMDTFRPFRPYPIQKELLDRLIKKGGD